MSSSLELGRENARKGLSGPGKGREPGHWDRNVHDKIKACCLRASPLFHLSSCGEFFRLEDLTSQGRRMGAGVCVGVLPSYWLHSRRPDSQLPSPSALSPTSAVLPMPP